MWFLGDNFMAKSFRDNMKNDPEMFVNKHFTVKGYCSSRFSDTNQNMLSRIENSFINVVNENKHLPKYVVVVLDNDLIEFLDYKNFGISQMNATWLQYIAESFAAAILAHKKLLNRSEARSEYPMIYWFVTLHHGLFQDNATRTKFNLAMESLLKVHSQQMRIAKFKDIWDYENNHYATRAGIMTSYGSHKY